MNGWQRRAGRGLVLALVLGWTVAAGAATPGDSPPPPERLVRATTERMIEAIRREREVLRSDRARLFALVEKIMLPHFDLERMAQRVLGKYWRRADRAQRERFVAEFRTLLMRTYATALLEYQDQEIRFLEPLERGDDVLVRTKVEQDGGPPIPIDYRLYRAEQGWKVYDVAIDGVSLVINYRSSFSAEIRRGGIDGLIARLARHNREGS